MLLLNDYSINRLFFRKKLLIQIGAHIWNIKNKYVKLKQGNILDQAMHPENNSLKDIIQLRWAIQICNTMSKMLNMNNNNNWMMSILKQVLKSKFKPKDKLKLKKNLPNKMLQKKRLKLMEKQQEKLRSENSMINNFVWQSIDEIKKYCSD